MGLTTMTCGARWRSLRLIAGLIVGLAATPACHGESARATERATVAPGGREGMTLPAYALKTMDGRELTSDALHGKVVIVDFWDTWCGPCLRALPHLRELSAGHPDNVVVVAIALGQEGEAKVREVTAKLQLPFAVAMFEAQSDLVPVFGNVDQLPTTFLVGPDGVIRRRWVGAQSLPTYENAVKALLSP